MNDRITRVKSLVLNNFRGFVGENVVDTDADIVFLSGPNGAGKTSLIDALCLVLTGHYYKEREPLLSYDEKHGRVAAKVSLRSKQEKTIEAILRLPEKGKRCDVKWTDGRELRVDDALKPLYARAGFYYQDILKYLFEEEEAEVYIEEFLLASDIPLGEIREASKHGLSLVENFEENFVTRSGFRPKAQIESERSSNAQELESALDAASEEISEVLGDFGFEGHTPKRPLTVQSGGMRKQWKENLVDLVHDYRKCFKFDSAHELTADLHASMILEALGESFQKLVSHRRQMRLKESSLHQQIRAFFAASSKGEGPVTEIAVSEERIGEMELEHRHLKQTVEELIKMRHLVEGSLRRYESAVDDGTGLVEILVELRRSGNAWLSQGELWQDSPERAPDDVLRWLESAKRELDEPDPPLDVQMIDWVQKQIDQRTALGEEVSKLEVSSKCLSQTIENSKEFMRILDRAPELSQAIPRYRGGMVSIEELAERLKMYTEIPSTEENRDALQRLALCTEAWADFEKQAEEDERARKSDMAYQAMKNELDGLKDALKSESGDAKSVTGAVQLIAPEKRKGFAGSIDAILGRLQIDSGLRPSKLDMRKIKRQSAWRYSTGDNRTLSCLSSGQKSLLGIASLISLNAALRNTLWADVLAFDDFTSSLDLNQIPRLAGLLRQIAYGSGVSEGADLYYRRQVFLVSHHEDLTNKLLDVLIPPPGRTMRVINFTGWSPEGPAFEELDIIGSSSGARDVRDSLPSLLNDELRRSFGMMD